MKLQNIFGQFLADFFTFKTRFSNTLGQNLKKYFRQFYLFTFPWLLKVFKIVLQKVRSHIAIFPMVNYWGRPVLVPILVLSHDAYFRF